LAAFDLIESAEGAELRAKLRANIVTFREGMAERGFSVGGLGFLLGIFQVLMFDLLQEILAIPSVLSTLEMLLKLLLWPTS
jgi:hypothetical protein